MLRNNHVGELVNLVVLRDVSVKPRSVHSEIPEVVQRRIRKRASSMSPLRIRLLKERRHCDSSSVLVQLRSGDHLRRVAPSMAAISANERPQR